MKANKHWPASEPVKMKVADLVPYARNARKHSKRQVDKLVASIREYGWTNPVLVDEDGGIIAGHGRVMAAKKLKAKEVPCIVAKGWTPAQKRAYVIADNQLALDADWDRELLKLELGELEALDFDLSLTGFEPEELDAILERETVAPEVLEAADKFDDVQETTVTRPGDLWILDQHRVLCGDSTDTEAVHLVHAGMLADLVHADPPYGMGKEAEGVANDNLRGAKLDAFQVSWARLALEHAKPNCGLYVWGNAADLWRLWYAGGLSELGDLLVRNELVWAKGSAIGMSAEAGHSYPPETERCLFLMRGQQFIGNQNKDDYWDGYEPLRQWLCQQRDAVEWTAKQVNKLTGTQMAGHWFGKSQFAVISRKHYDTLRRAADGAAFCATYDDLLDTYGQAKDGGNAHRRDLAAQMRESRTYFDNEHDNMTDVWHYGRVVGEERYGHATPKPVKMLARAVVSSCPELGLVFEPFLGTGSTLVAAELTKRRCFGVELEPAYVDVVVRRWQKVTGKAAFHSESGREFNAVETDTLQEAG